MYSHACVEITHVEIKSFNETNMLESAYLETQKNKF